MVLETYQQIYLTIILSVNEMSHYRRYVLRVYEIRNSVSLSPNFIFSKTLHPQCPLLLFFPISASLWLTGPSFAPTTIAIRSTPTSITVEVCHSPTSMAIRPLLFPFIHYAPIVECRCHEQSGWRDGHWFCCMTRLPLSHGRLFSWSTVEVSMCFWMLKSKN